MMNRYDFTYFFDVTDGNPNGDPDAGNLPRTDDETGQGLVTDVCLKRKIRNYVTLVKRNDNGEPCEGHDIYVREKAILNNQNDRAYKACELKSVDKKLPKKEEDAKRVTAWMCANFFDIRAFGAVMSTGVNCGQVRGPVQFAMARSIDTVIPKEFAITRCAVTTEKESKDQSGDNRTMGRKFTVPYGLYRVHGYINPHLAEQTGFGEEDLQLLWESLGQMFEYDRSAARGEMAPRRLIVFKHDSDLGNAPAHKLFERITTKLVNGSNGEWKPPRCFGDYKIEIDDSDLPPGITIIELI